MPRTSKPSLIALIVAEEITALMPGAGPPPTRIANLPADDIDPSPALILLLIALPECECGSAPRAAPLATARGADPGRLLSICGRKLIQGGKVSQNFTGEVFV